MLFYSPILISLVPVITVLPRLAPSLNFFLWLTIPSPPLLSAAMLPPYRISNQLSPRIVSDSKCSSSSTKMRAPREGRRPRLRRRLSAWLGMEKRLAVRFISPFPLSCMKRPS